MQEFSPGVDAWGLPRLQSTQTDNRLLFGLKQGRPLKRSFQRVYFYLATSFPTYPISWYLKPSELLNVRELIILWGIIQHPTGSISPTSRPIKFLSILQRSSIPEYGAQFCIQFINKLEGRWTWTRLRNGVENHLSNHIRFLHFFLSSWASQSAHSFTFIHVAHISLMLHRLVDFGNTPNAFAPFDESNDFRRSENFVQELQIDLLNLNNLRDILNNISSKLWVSLTNTATFTILGLS